MKTKFKILIVLLAITGLSKGLVAQTTFYANTGETLRVKCWDEDGSGNRVSLDTDCQINLNGDRWGHNADTIVVSGGPFYMEAGNESADYMSYDWSDGSSGYTYLITDDGQTMVEWIVDKYNQVTGYDYVGYFWVRFVYTSTFTVSDQSTGSPISGATVSVNGHGSQVTNASGNCSFSNLPNANYSYSITASGYDAVNSSFTVNKDNVNVAASMTANTSVSDIDGVKLNVYPNPCVDYLTIDSQYHDVQWTVYSVTGQVVKSGNGERIGMSDLKSGYYVLKIMTEVGDVNKKLLKQ